MTKRDHNFHEDQEGTLIAKCLHVIESLRLNQYNQSLVYRLRGKDDTAATTFYDLSEAQMSSSAFFKLQFDTSDNDSTSTAALSSSENYMPKMLLILTYIKIEIVGKTLQEFVDPVKLHTGRLLRIERCRFDIRLKFTICD